MSAPRPRRALAAVWVLLAMLVAAIVVIEYGDRRRAASTGAGEADGRLLLPVPVEQLDAIEIADRGRLHRFERDAARAWFYHGEHAGAAPDHAHAPDPLLAERIERAFAALGRARIERRFPLDRDGATYGVTVPDLLVLVYRPNETQPLAQIAVGHLAPDTVSRYVMLVGTREVATIPKYHVDNLLALIEATAAPSSPRTAERR